MRLLFHGLFFAVLGIAVSGCQRTPEGFPKVVPCQITVVKEGVPLPKVTIMFISEGGGKEWFVSANSGDNGVAEAQTLLGNFSKKGAPPGNYKVTLSQLPQVPDELTQQQRFDMSPAERAADKAKRDKLIAESRSFPVEFESSVTTPITIEVKDPNTEIRLDVSEWIGTK